MTKRRGWRETSGFVPKGKRHTKSPATSEERVAVILERDGAMTLPVSSIPNFLDLFLTERDKDPKQEGGLRRIAEHLHLSYQAFKDMGARWWIPPEEAFFPQSREPYLHDLIPHDAGVLLVPEWGPDRKMINLGVIDWNGAEYSFFSKIDR